MRDSSDALRRRGNDAYRKNDFYTAKNYYLQALTQLKKLSQMIRNCPDWVNVEYARISANLSLAELAVGRLAEALAASMESIRTNPTWAKVSLYGTIKEVTYLYVIMVVLKFLSVLSSQL